MGYALGMHPVEKAKIVHMLVDMGKQIGGPAASFAMLGKVPKWLLDTLWSPLPGFGHRARISHVDDLLVILKKTWLVVIGIDLTHTTLHEEKNDPLGLRRMVRLTRQNLSLSQSRGRHPAKTTACCLKK